MHSRSPSQPMGTAWEKHKPMMSQAMHGTRTVMTSNAFVKYNNNAIFLMNI